MLTLNRMKYLHASTLHAVDVWNDLIMPTVQARRSYSCLSPHFVRWEAGKSCQYYVTTVS